MKNRIAFLLILCSLSVNAQKDSIDIFINNQMKQQGIAGLSLGIIRNGKIIKAKGYGKANIELNSPATEKTVYKIASISKHMIAAGIMKLAQDGKLKVSDTITKFIKDVPAKWSSITIHQLLNHTSGLPLDPPGFDGMKEQPDSVFIKAATTDTLLFPSGSKYEYSNFGYFVLAEVIRKVSHLSFSNYMQKHIFNDYGLNNTRTTTLEAIVKNRASGYTRNKIDSVINAINYVAMRPSGAFLSNIIDLLKWEMMIQNNQLLTQESWARMWDNKIKTPFTMDDEPIYYGYGWMISKAYGRRLLHHGGSLPGFRSAYFRFIDDRTAIIILTNSDNSDAYGIAFGISDLLLTKK